CNMISTTSGFLSSTLSVSHNAVKSLFFRLAEILFALAIWKFFSLCAAKRGAFTSYLMFAEGIAQKAFYIRSRSSSGNGLFLLIFMIVYTAAKLYGTLLWALDAPGFVAQTEKVTAASLSSSLVDDPGYIILLKAKADNPDSLTKDMPGIIGVNLFK